MYLDFPEINDLIIQDKDIKIPKMVTIRQHFDAHQITDIPRHVREQMRNSAGDPAGFQGKSIAITSGSRGIPHIDVILKAICDVLKEWGARPFVVPAMGSHGGATAKGQAEVLASYGITEERIGAPVRSSMDVVQYGSLPNGIPLYCDKLAFESDGIVICHKIKPHTDFRNNHESGLCKMIAIGLGKHKGATAIHSQGFAEFGSFITGAAEQFLKVTPVAFGVGIIQNAYDDLHTIEVIPRDQIMEADERLLKVAKRQMAGFKFDDIDVLIIDRIGKNISGYGFDPNVVGRSNSRCYGFENPVRIKRLFIRGLTAESHHNGSGINEADVTTRRCLNDIDWSETWTNLITCTEIQGAKIPMYLNNDREALIVAMSCCNGAPRPHRVVRIKDTLSMKEIQVSEALYESIKDQPDIEYVRGPEEIRFDEKGFMIDGGDFMS